MIEEYLKWIRRNSISRSNRNLREIIYDRLWSKVYGTYYFEVLRYRQRIPDSVEIKRNRISCTSSLRLTGICNVYIG